MLILSLLSLSLSLGAQSPGPDTGASILPLVPAETPFFSDTGDAAIARRYLEWAGKEMAAGRTSEALAALERGADYGDASSDISFLLAILRSAEGRSRFSVLEACRRALETDRWEQYNSQDARLLEAKILAGLRRFEESLNVLDRCDPERYETQYQRLLTLRGFAFFYGEEAELIKVLNHTMDSFPRETDPIRILFDYAARTEANNSLRPLIDLALRRLPFLMDSDPELAYLAVPFIRDREESRRYIASYRAAGNPNPASLPAALELGLINGMEAVEELFARPDSGSAITLDKKLITAVHRLLQSEDERELLRRNLLQFSGVITEDEDYDGIVEAWITWRNGMILEYRCDTNQSGEAELIITFAQGLPDRAEVVLAPPDETPLGISREKRVLIRWEQYPAVLDAELEGKRYIPRPFDYFYTPVRFAPLVFGGPDYPERETFLPVLTERSLLSFASVLEQSSEEFTGGLERIELSNSLPVKSVVYVEGRKVSETEFRQGRPIIQYLDLDMDGRMETIRRYDPDEAYRVLSTESDWDGDGIYEYAETLQDDGTIKKSWDFNRDGIRETNR